MGHVCEELNTPTHFLYGHGEQVSKAQLEALRRQLEPHFLFNSLNTITGLVREERHDAAVTMIARLSDLLRRVIDDPVRQETTLADELEFLEKYLDIQRARFAERLRVITDVPSDLLHAQVLMLLLQPLVENAIQHGVTKRLSGGSVRIVACRTNGTLTMTVCNDGPPLAADSSHGVGIKNVRTRLQTLYGDHCEFVMENQPGGVAVRVSVPYRTL